MGKSRFIWEQITEEPDIYKVTEVGSRQNCYFVASKGEALLIDPRSADMLRSILRLSRAFDIMEGKSRVFFTGIADRNIYNALRSQLPKATVYSMVIPQYTDELPEDSGEELGGGQACGEELHGAQAGGAQAGDGTQTGEGEINATQVRDGDVIRVGDQSLRCISAEGSRRGQMALLIPDKGILFAGGAVGCDYVPDVEIWDEKIDALGLQIETLRRFKQLRVRCILPGYGASASCASAAEVIDKMLAQYAIQILEVYQKVPAFGSIAEEDLLKRQCGERAPEGAGVSGADVRDAGPSDTGRCGIESCLRYLLYRKYIRRKEEEPSHFEYRRGSMNLTDWELM